MRILILDDRATNREIIASYLDESGAETTCVETPEAALRALREAQSASRPFSLAIIDMVLPGSSGLEVADMIKAEPSIASVGLMMLTSLSWKADMQSARDRGFQAFLTKPVHRKDLIDSVTNTLAHAQRAWTPSAELPAQPTEHKRQREMAVRVLVVEDNPVNVEVAQEYLGNLGCAIKLAGNGVEAVAAFSEPRFDIILMDCQMPVMDGLEATRRIREAEKILGTARTPIVAVTANAYAEDRAKCLAAGMDDYLSKPFTEAQLAQLLSKWSNLPASEAGSVMNVPASRGVVSAASERTKPTKSNNKGAGRPRNKRAAAPQAPAASATESFDKDVLGRLKNSHPALLARLIETYLSVAPELLSQILAAAAEGNHDVLRATAHSLKSSSANVGAAKLSDLCRDLEHLLKTNQQADATAWRPLVTGIESELAAAIKELAAVEEAMRSQTMAGGLKKARAQANK